MLQRTRAVLIGLLALVTGGIVAAAPAGAITGGVIDSANTYSNVGMIAFYDDGTRYRCSATLVTRRSCSPPPTARTAPRARRS